MTRSQRCLLKIGCEIQFTQVGICLPMCLIIARPCLLLPASFARLLTGKMSFPNTACIEMQEEGRVTAYQETVCISSHAEPDS